VLWHNVVLVLCCLSWTGSVAATTTSTTATTAAAQETGATTNATNAGAPSTTPAPSPVDRSSSTEVVFSFRIMGLDFQALSADAGLMQSLTSAIQMSIAAEADNDIRPEDALLEYSTSSNHSSSSILVEVAIASSLGASAASVLSTLTRAAAVSMSSSLATAVGGVSGIQVVSHSTILVTDISAITLDLNLGPGIVVGVTRNTTTTAAAVDEQQQVSSDDGDSIELGLWLAAGTVTFLTCFCALYVLRAFIGKPKMPTLPTLAVAPEEGAMHDTHAAQRPVAPIRVVEPDPEMPSEYASESKPVPVPERVPLAQTPVALEPDPEPREAANTAEGSLAVSQQSSQVLGHPSASKEEEYSAHTEKAARPSAAQEAAEAASASANVVAHSMSPEAAAPEPVLLAGVRPPSRGATSSKHSPSRSGTAHLKTGDAESFGSPKSRVPETLLSKKVGLLKSLELVTNCQLDMPSHASSRLPPVVPDATGVLPLPPAPELPLAPEPAEEFAATLYDPPPALMHAATAVGQPRKWPQNNAIRIPRPPMVPASVKASEQVPLQWPSPDELDARLPPPPSLPAPPSLSEC